MAKARRGHRSNDEFLGMFQGRRLVLRRWLNSNYDLTIVDCPPSIAIQVKTFLAVADAYIVPAIPDRLSVRGSLHLLNRIRRSGFKIEGLGTVWSLYREQNGLHRRMVDVVSRRVVPFDQLPKPFETIIPNATAIAEATEPDRKPRLFNAKYTPPFRQALPLALPGDRPEEPVAGGECQRGEGGPPGLTPRHSMRSIPEAKGSG
jgi:chromosome partitioning protein